MDRFHVSYDDKEEIITSNIHLREIIDLVKEKYYTKNTPIAISIDIHGMSNSPQLLFTVGTNYSYLMYSDGFNNWDVVNNPSGKNNGFEYLYLDSHTESLEGDLIDHETANKIAFDFIEFSGAKSNLVDWKPT